MTRQRTVPRDWTFRHGCAWLALAAMWLAILSPVVSRTLPGTAMPMAMHHAAAAGDGHGPAAPTHPHGGLLDRCGYCQLLASQPLLPSVPPTIALLPVLPMRTQVLPRPRPATTDRPASTGPRGPPAPPMA